MELSGNRCQWNSTGALQKLFILPESGRPGPFWLILQKCPGTKFEYEEGYERINHIPQLQTKAVVRKQYIEQAARLINNAKNHW